MDRSDPTLPRLPQARAERDFSLKSLEPPGDFYKDWFNLTADSEEGEGVEALLAPDTVEVLARALSLAPLYDNAVPEAALHLDMMIDAGELRLRVGETVYVRSLDRAAELLGQTPAAGVDVRTCLHWLHSAGALLVTGTEDEPVVELSMPPASPGEHLFSKGPHAEGGGFCLPHDAVLKLKPEQTLALCHIRERRGQGAMPTPEGLLAYLPDRMASLDNARRLLEEVYASGWADARGCPSCPVVSLCSREEGEVEEATAAG